MKRFIHARCLAIGAKAGRTLICGKSPEHVHSTDAGRREHYDPSADERWSDDDAGAGR
jgi:hypothetical protein